MGAANIVLLANVVARTYCDKATSLNFMRTDLVLVDHFLFLPFISTPAESISTTWRC